MMEQFLSYGSIGVGLASLGLAVKLIMSEQKREQTRSSVIRLIYAVMAFGLVITVFGFVNEIKGESNSTVSLPSFSVAKNSHEKSPDGKLLVALEKIYIGVNDNIYADIRIGVYPKVRDTYKLQVNQGYSDVFSINGNEYIFTVVNISDSGSLITVSWGAKP